MELHRKFREILQNYNMENNIQYRIGTKFFTKKLGTFILIILGFGAGLNSLLRTLVVESSRQKLKNLYPIILV